MISELIPQSVDNQINLLLNLTEDAHFWVPKLYANSLSSIKHHAPGICKTEAKF